MQEGLDQSKVSFDDRLQVEAVIAEPENEDTLLKEKAEARAKEVGLRLYGLKHISKKGAVCYRTEEQSGTNNFTRAWTTRRHGENVSVFASDRTAVLVTEEAVELDGRVATYEDSKTVHLTVHGQGDERGRDDTTEQNIRVEVPGATARQQLDFLDAVDKILDLIEETHATRSV